MFGRESNNRRQSDGTDFFFYIFLPKSRGIIPAAPLVPTGQLLRLPVVFRGSGITQILVGKS